MYIFLCFVFRSQFLSTSVRPATTKRQPLKARFAFANSLLLFDRMLYFKRQLNLPYFLEYKPGLEYRPGLEYKPRVVVYIQI